MIHYAAIMAVLIVILHSLPGITRSLDADFTRLDPVPVLKQLGCWVCSANILKQQLAVYKHSKSYNCYESVLSLSFGTDYTWKIRQDHPHRDNHRQLKEMRTGWAVIKVRGGGYDGQWGSLSPGWSSGPAWDGTLTVAPRLQPHRYL